MISVLNYNDYKEYLRDLLTEEGVPRGYQSSMAKAMNCQAAYLSQSLRGKVELTEDHGVKLVKFLGLSAFDSDFFLLLLRLSRATTPELRDYLNQKRIEQKKIGNDLQTLVHAKSARDSEEFIARYFSSSIPTVIHVATSSTDLQTVSAIAKRFSFDEKLVKDTLLFLEKYKLVKREKEKFIFSGESIHLPKTSASNVPYQVSLRTQVIKAIQEKAPESGVHFSSVFTMDKKAFKDIQAVLNRAIEDSHKVIHKSGTEEVYSLCVDFFRV